MPGRIDKPAAFGRLCVETPAPEPDDHRAAAMDKTAFQPPSGGWVLKHILEIPLRHLPASRLQAAIYQYNSEISYNKGRLKTLSIGFQTTFFSHQHKPDTLE